MPCGVRCALVFCFTEMDYLQFFPTPPRLVHKLWSLFKNREFQRVLDPSAGDGALLRGHPSYGNRRQPLLDAIEIDASKHPVLRERGISVVGVDFLNFESGAVYSHLVLNPPFRHGAAHVLKAWKILFDGEIAAIINAETLRNPFSAERQQLVKLVGSHGSVEFIRDGFMGSDVERETPVEIALVYLRKQADVASIVGDVLGALRADMEAERLTDGVDGYQELMVPATFIENSVLAFNAAVLAMKECVLAEAKAEHYAGFLGQTLAERNGDNSDKARPVDNTAHGIRERINERYDKLKDRAWASILRSTEVQAKLSSSAEKRMESEFEHIKTLSFTVANIYGFLAGLSEAGWEIQVGMMCDVFDTISAYGTDNTVHYMGWRSNDRHRTGGRRVKTTRFIIPGFAESSYSISFPYQAMRMLSDFDKVLAMLDGVSEPEVSLEWVAKNKYRTANSSEPDLYHADRLSSSYFDIRYFRGRGTLHFFPRRKDLIERLNRLVGQHRKWLPPDDVTVGKDYWAHYDRAEKHDTEVRRQADALRRTDIRFSEVRESQLLHGQPEEKALAEELFATAALVVAERHGLKLDLALESPVTCDRAADPHPGVAQPLLAFTL